MIFLVQFGINKHSQIFQRLQIALALRVRAIFCSLWKSCSCLFIPNCTRNHLITYTNNYKTEKFKLTFEGWNRPVCNLFGFTRVSFCQNCISPSNSEANRDGADAESPFPLFFSFSASFKNSSPREKVGNCLRFGTGGWSLCFYPLLSRNIWIFFPHANNGRSREKKKILAKRFAHAISARVHYRDLEHAYVTEFDCVALLAML